MESGKTPTILTLNMHQQVDLPNQNITASNINKGHIYHWKR